MKELTFQKELMLLRQINQKNVCFVTIGNFLHKNFNYGPYLCDECYIFSQTSRDFKNIAIADIKKIHTECIFHV